MKHMQLLIFLPLFLLVVSVKTQYYNPFAITNLPQQQSHLQQPSLYQPPYQSFFHQSGDFNSLIPGATNENNKRKVLVVEGADERLKDSLSVRTFSQDDPADPFQTKNPYSFLIGGMFEPGTEDLEDAFSQAIDQGNEARVLGNLRLHAKVDHLAKANSFQASRQVCQLIRHGVLALYGPQSLETTTHVESLASTLQIPHLEARIDFKPPRNHSVNFMPNPFVLVEAYRDLVKQSQWQSYAIVYDSDESLLRIQEFLKDPEMEAKNILIRRANGTNDKQILTELKVRAVRNIILDMASDRRNSRLSLFMGSALEEGMTGKFYHYIITSLDLENADVVPIAATIHSFTLTAKSGSTNTVGAALTYDAITHFIQSLSALNSMIPLQKHKLACRSTEGWAYGHEIRENLIKTVTRGLTGIIKFDENGIRSDFTLRLLQNTDKGMKSVGSWTPRGRLTVNNDFAALSSGTGATFRYSPLVRG